MNGEQFVLLAGLKAVADVMRRVWAGGHWRGGGGAVVSLFYDTLMKCIRTEADVMCIQPAGRTPVSAFPPGEKMHPINSVEAIDGCIKFHWRGVLVSEA